MSKGNYYAQLFVAFTIIKEDFNEKDIIELDRFRRIRNGIKYYGKDCDESDAESAIKLANNII